MKVSKHLFTVGPLAVNAFLFTPEKATPSTIALFTHGYTSSKSSILNWALRLDEQGITSVLFDLPGHYLGSFNDVSNFDDFKNFTPQLFQQALDTAQVHNKTQYQKIFIGGHSLGALMAMKAVQENFITTISGIICVGFGLPEINQKHVFQSEIFRRTIDMRAQLVSKEIHPELVFPWINQQKHLIQLRNQNILLITGQDDVVVGQKGLKEMEAHLLKNNLVQLENPKRLPHNQPEMAASFIAKFITENS